MALIAAEAAVVGAYVASLYAGRQVRLNLGIPATALFIVAWVFLFFGSPFLVRSQGWLAILGWLISVGVMLFRVCENAFTTPARDKLSLK